MKQAIRLVWFLWGCLAVLPASAFAQSIHVQVLAAESGEPIPAAFVTLITQADSTTRHALTDPGGRALFTVSDSGTYRLKAEMLGRSTQRTRQFRVAGDSTVLHVMELSVEPIPLTSMEVESGQECRMDPLEGEEVARVWEEVRKVLTIQSRMPELGSYRFQILSWDRELSPEGDEVVTESSRRSFTAGRNPIRSLPVEELVRDGFLQRPAEQEVEYFGPDASVLLSNAFLGTHCFRLWVDPARPELIGLAFEARREDVADIEGTFWLDRETGHLRFLDFDYVNLPRLLDAGVAKGRVEFDQLADGAWVVRKWWIRAPIVARSWINGVLSLVGVREVGQEIVAERPLPAALPARRFQATPDSALSRRRVGEGVRILEGSVVEAKTGRPIAGATVILADRAGSWEAESMSDGLGRFSFRPSTPGSYLLTTRRMGYREAGERIPDPGEGRALGVRVFLHPQPIELDELVVEAQRQRIEDHLSAAGFYHRREMGFGHFLGPEELEAFPPLDSRDLLQGIPGIRIVDNGFAGRSIRCPRATPARDPYVPPRASAGNPATAAGSGAAPVVYLDGVLMSFSDLQATPGPDVDLDQLGLESIAAVEVFTRATQVPLQFSGTGAGCVILVWTKR